MQIFIRYSFYFIFLLGTTSVFAQQASNGIKGGLTVGTQRWNGADREPLLSYNVSYVYETFTSNEKFSYLMDIGYHVKGSAVRSNYTDLSGNFRQITTKNKFGNVSLLVGAKSRLDASFVGGNLYYLIGARLEYTVWDSLETLANLSRFVNRINYGVTAGGGVEFQLSDKVQGFFEIQISPDFSQQIFMPPGNYVANYGGTTTLVPFSEQKVTNTVIEATIGVKLVRY